MRTKVLYVLVSNENDIFWEQTFLSIQSLLRTNGSTNITVLMDNLTYYGLKDKRAVLLSLISEPVVIDLDQNLSNKEKSRILKTNMRNYVDGDFLYVDTDTIILGDLSDIDRCEYDLAAVYERNRPFKDDFGRVNHIETMRRLGGNPHDSDEYFNSGVMLVKDTLFNREFFASWLKRWKQGVGRNVYFDQPSLACVNKEFNNPIHVLDGKWNCQGRYCFCYIREAKIFHYLYDRFFDFPLLKKEFFYSLKDNPIITLEIESILQNPVRYVSPINEIITGGEVKRMRSRMYSGIRSIDMKYPIFYNLIEKCLDNIYKFFLSFKKRKLAPPR